MPIPSSEGIWLSILQPSTLDETLNSPSAIGNQSSVIRILVLQTPIYGPVFYDLLEFPGAPPPPPPLFVLILP